MNNTTIRQVQKTPNQQEQKNTNVTDRMLLWGLPVRHSAQLPETDRPQKDWFVSLLWLRVCLLLLGVVGALGLLAHYNPRFAEVSQITCWPGWTLSVIFLGLAGCVFMVLLIDWGVNWTLRPCGHGPRLEPKNWRSQ